MAFQLSIDLQNSIEECGDDDKDDQVTLLLAMEGVAKGGEGYHQI